MYKKFELEKTIYSIIKINNDGTALEVSNFMDMPKIETWAEITDVFSDYVDATEQEFLKFYVYILGLFNEKTFN